VCTVTYAEYSSQVWVTVYLTTFPTTAPNELPNHDHDENTACKCSVYYHDEKMTSTSCTCPTDVATQLDRATLKDDDK